MAVQLEVEINTVVIGQEALCLVRRLYPLHLPFSTSYWLVESLCPVVQIATLPMFGLWQDFSLGRRTAKLSPAQKAAPPPVIVKPIPPFA